MSEGHWQYRIAQPPTGNTLNVQPSHPNSYLAGAGGTLGPQQFAGSGGGGSGGHGQPSQQFGLQGHGIIGSGVKQPGGVGKPVLVQKAMVFKRQQ